MVVCSVLVLLKLMQQSEMKDLLYSEAAGQPNPKDDGNHNPKGADK
jgi:hypothetical protein